MIIAHACLCICYQVAAMPITFFYLFRILGVINPSLNPIVYAARYEVFRRYVKQKLCKKDVAPANINDH